MANPFLNWWDRSLWNKPIIFKAEILYHGTTRAYYSQQIKKDTPYFEHTQIGLSQSEEKEIFFETDRKKAIAWACSFAKRYNDSPVLVIVSTRKIRDLRRTIGKFYPYYRTDRVLKDDLIMVNLEFKDDSWKKRWILSPYRDLTPACKEKINLAEIKLRAQFAE